MTRTDWGSMRRVEDGRTTTAGCIGHISMSLIEVR
jgi:hypothetical protein